MSGRRFYRHTFAVDGYGAFPLDMLRYDSSWPHTGDDAGKLEAEDRDRRAVTLCHIGPSYWVPTVGRWSSFGWSVVDHVKEPA